MYLGNDDSAPELASVKNQQSSRRSGKRGTRIKNRGRHSHVKADEMSGNAMAPAAFDDEDDSNDQEMALIGALNSKNLFANNKNSKNNDKNFFSSDPEKMPPQITNTIRTSVVPTDVLKGKIIGESFEEGEEVESESESGSAGSYLMAFG